MTKNDKTRISQNLNFNAFNSVFLERLIPKQSKRHDILNQKYKL